MLCDNDVSVCIFLCLFVVCVIVVVIVGVTNSLVNCYGYYCYPTLKIKI